MCWCLCVCVDPKETCELCLFVDIKLGQLGSNRSEREGMSVWDFNGLTMSVICVLVSSMVCSPSLYPSSCPSASVRYYPLGYFDAHIFSIPLLRSLSSLACCSIRKQLLYCLLSINFNYLQVDIESRPCRGEGPSWSRPRTVALSPRREDKSSSA